MTIGSVHANCTERHTVNTCTSTLVHTRMNENSVTDDVAAIAMNERRQNRRRSSATNATNYMLDK